MNKEIEVKAILSDRGAVMEKLESLGCVFSEQVSQEDTVYVENIGDLEIFLANKVFLRIRVQNNSKIIFTAKQRTGALVAIEHEVSVSSEEEMKQILGMMGYQRAIQVNKVRQKTQYDGCEICIDEVEGIGSFIEMESITDEDPGKVQEKLFDFLVSVGVDRAQQVKKGYDILMFEKNLK